MHNIVYVSCEKPKYFTETGSGRVSFDSTPAPPKIWMVPLDVPMRVENVTAECNVLRMTNLRLEFGWSVQRQALLC